MQLKEVNRLRELCLCTEIVDWWDLWRVFTSYFEDLIIYICFQQTPISWLTKKEKLNKICVNISKYSIKGFNSTTSVLENVIKLQNELKKDLHSSKGVKIGFTLIKSVCLRNTALINKSTSSLFSILSPTIPISQAGIQQGVCQSISMAPVLFSSTINYVIISSIFC